MLKRLRVQIRSYHRRLTRRVAQAAWALGGTGIAFLFANGVAREFFGRMDLPWASIGLWFAASAIVVTIARIAFSGFRSLERVVDLTETEEGLEFVGGLCRTKLTKKQVLGVMHAKDVVWLFLSRGRLIRIEGLNADGAKALEDRFDTGARVRIEPEAKGWNALASLAAFGTICLLSMIVAAIFTFAGTMLTVGMVLSIVGAAAIARAFRGQELELGQDGIHIGGEFFAYPDMRDVSVVGNSFAVVRKSGESKKFPISVEATLAAAILARIHDRMGAPEVEAASLSKAPSESLQAWITRLRGLFHAEGFREKATHKDEVKEVLHSTNTPPHVRIAAAVALANDHRGEVETLLEQTADPAVQRLVRIVLDKPELLEEHLEKVLPKPESEA